MCLGSREESYMPFLPQWMHTDIFMERGKDAASFNCISEPWRHSYNAGGEQEPQK